MDIDVIKQSEMNVNTPELNVSRNTTYIARIR